MSASEPIQLPIIDAALQAATISVLRERGWEGLTLERVAEVAGRARSTLWRQGVTREVLIAALAGQLDADFRTAMYPILTSGGTGLERLERGLLALCSAPGRPPPVAPRNRRGVPPGTASRPRA